MQWLQQSWPRPQGWAGRRAAIARVDPADYSRRIDDKGYWLGNEAAPVTLPPGPNCEDQLPFSYSHSLASAFHLKFLAIVDELAGYRDRISDRVDGVAASLDQVNHLSNFLGWRRALNIQNVGYPLACGREKTADPR